MGGRARVWFMLSSPQWIAYLSTRFLPAVSSGTQCSRNTTNIAHSSHTTIHAKVKEFWDVAKEETVETVRSLELVRLDFWQMDRGNKRYLGYYPTVNARFLRIDFITLGNQDDQGLEHSEGRHFAQISHASIRGFQVYLEQYHGHNHWQWWYYSQVGETSAMWTHSLFVTNPSSACWRRPIWEMKP